MSAGFPSIVQSEARDDGLVICFDGHSESLAVPWRWVRDHSEDPTSLDPVSRQRLVDTFAIADDVRGVSATVIDGAVRVRWNDDAPDAELSVSLLAEVAGLATGSAPRPWRAGSLPDPLPSVPFDRVMSSDEGVSEWLDAVDEVGFGLVRQMPADARDAEALARRVAVPRSSIFGSMWTLSSELTDHSDSAYSQTFLEPHTDGSYSRDAPGLQMFACIDRVGTGGESILVDGFAAAERLRAEDPDHFEVLTKVSVPGRYVEPGVHLTAARPSISLDAAGAVCQVTINNYDRAPFVLPASDMEQWYAAYGHFHSIVNDRDDWLLIRLEPGDVLLFDNWRTLHGRMAYTGTRLFEGCYHNREDFESRRRVLQAGGRRGTNAT